MSMAADEHMMKRLYSAEFDFPQREVPPRTRILIATIPRSGSTHLCLTLWRTGALGAPMEYLNLQNRAGDMLPRLGCGDEARYWDALRRVRVSPNGVFASKVFTSDLEQVRRRQSALLAEIDATTTIYFTREDKLGQAISYARAVQTGKWFSNAGELSGPVYDRSLIEAGFGWVTAQEEQWERVFALTGCAPFRISYEEVLADTEACTARIAAAAGVDLGDGAALPVPGLEIQRDGISRAWRQRYEGERGGGSTTTLSARSA